jgi:translocator protein
MSSRSEGLPRPAGAAWVGLVIWVGLTALAAAIGSTASLDAAAFYGTLSKPSWAPPPWVFGPAWTLLYACMAVAAWLVWRTPGARAVRGALVLYVIQLSLNALWSWFFFRWRAGGWALLEILALWAVLLATLVRFWRVRPISGVLLVPYIAWVSFAAALTAAVWRRNPGLL